MRVHTFQGFLGSKRLTESVQMAKDYLVKKYAEKKKVRASEVPEEERKRIFNDPKFLEVKELVGGTGGVVFKMTDPRTLGSGNPQEITIQAKNEFPGYTWLFTVFAYEQGANINQLKELLGLMKIFKTNLKDDPNAPVKNLPMPINDYAKVVPDKKDTRPGYERLSDDLARIPNKIKLRKFYSEMVQPLKNEFNKATPEEIDELEEISKKLANLPDREEIDQNGNVIRENCWRKFMLNMFRYDNYSRYPEFKDTKFAFKRMLSDARDHINSWERDDETIVKKILELGNMASLLFNKGGYIAFSARDPEVVRKLAADCDWCIRFDSSFWSYAGSKTSSSKVGSIDARVQLIILNRNLSSLDLLSAVGVTLSKIIPGQNPITITNAHDRKDGSLMGNYKGSPAGFFQNLGYPKPMIDSVISKLPNEFTIKFIFESAERGLNLPQGRSTTSVVLSLLLASKRSLDQQADVEISDAKWKELIGILFEYLLPKYKIGKKEILEEFKNSGINTKTALAVFESVIGSDYTREDLESIIKKTESLVEHATYSLKIMKSPGPLLDLANEIAKDGPGIIQILKRKL